MRDIGMKNCLKLATLIVFATAAAAGIDPGWEQAYRTGEITLKADAAFARGADWEAMLFDGFQDLVVSPDGSIFVANGRQHTIQKFDPSGRLVATFGRHGQGPGDLQNPGSPGILDGKLLAVSEYASLQRISLFDLNGKFVKIVKTQGPVFDLVPLKGNRIAYLSQKSSLAPGTRLGAGARLTPAEARVAVLDVDGGPERTVWKADISIDSVILGTGGAIGIGDSLTGTPFIAATADGDLAVGFSAETRIDLFSPRGEPVKRFDIDIPAIPVRPEHVERFRRSLLGESDGGAARPFREALAKADFAALFGERLPFYRDFRVDSEGNFLFFLWDEDFGKGKIFVSAFAPEGRPIGRFELKPGDFAISIDRRFRKLCFSADGLIGLAPLRNDPDGSPRLFRSPLR
jgi:hypothetical protein